jgi:Lrp/AsnC family leucine-responsive transcriptional regulator
MTFDSALDDVAWKLLRELQENARLSYSELGRRVGLTAPAVAERLRRMEDAGIIAGYRVDVRMDRVGLPLQAIVRLRCTEGWCGRFGPLAKDLPEVLECYRVTGSDSYVLRIAVESVQHLESLIDRLNPYGETTTSLVLSTPVPHRTIAPPPLVEPSAARRPLLEPALLPQ